LTFLFARLSSDRDNEQVYLADACKGLKCPRPVDLPLSWQKTSGTFVRKGCAICPQSLLCLFYPPCPTKNVIGVNQELKIAIENVTERQSIFSHFNSTFQIGEPEKPVDTIDYPTKHFNLRQCSLNHQPRPGRTSPSKSGWIEVICGCMFSGKTEELIRRLNRALIARQKRRNLQTGHWTNAITREKL